MSGRKGYMSDTPFHVENIRYMYAVERHESTPSSTLLNEKICVYNKNGVCKRAICKFYNKACKGCEKYNINGKTREYFSDEYIKENERQMRIQAIKENKIKEQKKIIKQQQLRKIEEESLKYREKCNYYQNKRCSALNTVCKAKDKCLFSIAKIKQK